MDIPEGTQIGVDGRRVPVGELPATTAAEEFEARQAALYGTGGGETNAGTALVERANVALGTQSTDTEFTWYEIAGACTRGLVSLFVVTADTAGDFDLQVRDAAAGGGNVFLEALNVTADEYSISWPFYVQGTADSIWVGLRNNDTADHTFTVSELRLEKFA